MKILWFSPYAAVWDWRYQEFIIQKYLKVNKYNLKTISCNNILEKNCNAINAHHTNLDKNIFKSKMICKRCISNNKFLEKKLDTENYDLNKLITEKDKQKTNIILRKINKKNILKYNYKNIPIGKIAMFEIILEFKKNNLDLSNFEFKKLKNNFENCINTIWAFEKISKDFRPDVVITYNGSYAVNNLFLKFFKQKKATPYLITGSTNNNERLTNIHLFKESYFDSILEIKKNWVKLKKYPYNKSDAISVIKHMKTLFFSSTSHTFSHSIKDNYINIKEYFKIKKDQKIILVSMSSYDEVLSAYLLYTKKSLGGIFKDQIEWIENIIKNFKNINNYFIIFRPHPREFLKTNDNYYLRKLKKIFSSLPSNMCVNYPKDKISIHNLGMETSLLLNAWSSAGEDLGMLGIPTISISKSFMNYPSDIDYYEDNKKKYFKKIFKILKKDNWSINRIELFYRFKSLMFNKSTIKLKKFMPKHYYFMRFIKLIDKISLFFGLPSFIKFKLFNFNNINNDKELKKFLLTIKKKLYSPININLNSMKKNNYRYENSKNIKFIIDEIKNLLFLTTESKKTPLYKKFKNILNK